MKPAPTVDRAGCAFSLRHARCRGADASTRIGRNVDARAACGSMSGAQSKVVRSKAVAPAATPLRCRVTGCNGTGLPMPSEPAGAVVAIFVDR